MPTPPCNRYSPQKSHFNFSQLLDLAPFFNNQRLISPARSRIPAEILRNQLALQWQATLPILVVHVLLHRLPTGILGLTIGYAGNDRLCSRVTTSIHASPRQVTNCPSIYIDVERVLTWATPVIYMFVFGKALLININHHRDGIVKGQFCEGFIKTSVKGIKGRNKRQESSRLQTSGSQTGNF